MLLRSCVKLRSVEGLYSLLRWSPSKRSVVRTHIEEMRKLRGLGAKVLVRSLDGSTEMCGRVPRPPGIVENGAGESDQVGFARAEDGLGLDKIGDEPHRNYRHCG